MPHKRKPADLNRPILAKPDKGAPKRDTMGRPSIEIDWKKVRAMLQAGANGVEVAAALGCAPDTLYNRCIQECGMTFSAYQQQMKEAGRALLRTWQFAAAQKGNTAMLIWLGKNVLGQSDEPLVESKPEGERPYILMPDGQGGTVRIDL